MKKLFAFAIVTSALAWSVQAADVSVKLTDVHLCCQSCVKGVQKAVGQVPGVTATADMDEGTVSLTGPDTAAVQKAVDALTGAGYFGKSSDPAIKVSTDTGTKDQKVQSLQVEGVHLCCGKCVKAVNEALASVSGVTTNTAAKGVKSFTVSGDFNEQEVFAALQKAGLTGKVGK
ncbi:MAG TPA: cation transporter [Candidatus Acidoferrum sp.]|nr:cation transporter [Candidatus Acidoferrum sp.]